MGNWDITLEHARNGWDRQTDGWAAHTHKMCARTGHCAKSEAIYRLGCQNWAQRPIEKTSCQNKRINLLVPFNISLINHPRVLFPAREGPSPNQNAQALTSSLFLLSQKKKRHTIADPIRVFFKPVSASDTALPHQPPPPHLAAKAPPLQQRDQTRPDRTRTGLPRTTDLQSKLWPVLAPQQDKTRQDTNLTAAACTPRLGPPHACRLPPQKKVKTRLLGGCGTHPRPPRVPTGSAGGRPTGRRETRLYCVDTTSHPGNEERHTTFSTKKVLIPRVVDVRTRTNAMPRPSATPLNKPTNQGRAGIASGEQMSERQTITRRPGRSGGA